MHLLIGFIFVGLVSIVLKLGPLSDALRSDHYGYTLGLIAGSLLFYLILVAISFYVMRLFGRANGRTYTTTRAAYPAAFLVALSLFADSVRDVEMWRFETSHDPSDKSEMLLASTRDAQSSAFLVILCQYGAYGVVFRDLEKAQAGELVAVSYRIDGAQPVSHPWLNANGQLILTGGDGEALVGAMLTAKDSVRIDVGGSKFDFGVESLAETGARVVSQCPTTAESG